VAAPVRSGDERSSRWGYLGAILVSAIGHAAFFILLLVVLPSLFRTDAPPPAYTVKIVDQIPAGDLGTHLPRLSQERRKHETPRHEKPRAEAKPKPTPPAADKDNSAIALNTNHTPTPTPTPPPPPPKPEATATPTPKKKHQRKPGPSPTPASTPTPKRAERRKPKPTPTPAVAKAESATNVKQKLSKVREQLMAEHLREMKAKATVANAAKPNPETGGGPVEASAETPGKGMGIGGGSGSAGIQQDPEFLLYYQNVQDKIKKAWSFAGSNPDLTATVTFGINPDGSLNAVTVTASSKDPAFDDSVMRAIRRAAPFTPPPDKYRPQFAAGIEAVFKLGELSS
jgi:TonB family protein